MDPNEELLQKLTLQRQRIGDISKTPGRDAQTYGRLCVTATGAPIEAGIVGQRRLSYEGCDSDQGSSPGSHLDEDLPSPFSSGRQHVDVEENVALFDSAKLSNDMCDTKLDSIFEEHSHFECVRGLHDPVHVGEDSLLTACDEKENVDANGAKPIYGGIVEPASDDFAKVMDPTPDDLAVPEEVQSEEDEGKLQRLLVGVGSTLSPEKTYEALRELTPTACASDTSCLAERLLDPPELPLEAVGAEPTVILAAPSRDAMSIAPNRTVLMDAQCRHHDDLPPPLVGTSAAKLCNKQQEEEEVPAFVEIRRVSGQERSDWCGAPKGVGRNSRNCMDPSSLCGAESDDDETPLRIYDDDERPFRTCTPRFREWGASGKSQRPVMTSSTPVIAHL